MGDKFTNFLKLPEVEQTLLSQQKEMLGTSDDDEYKDFICDNDSNCSGIKEVDIQEKLDMDNKEMLNESFCSHDEDFRAKASPPQTSKASASLSFNKPAVGPKFTLEADLQQKQPNLDELFAKHASISSDDEDFVCVSSPPKSTEVPSFESVFDGVVDKDEVHPNRCSDSSQDEDFRLRDSTPPLLGLKKEAKIDTIGNDIHSNSKESLSVDSSCQNECERTDNFRDDGITSEDSDSELLENGNLSPNENQDNLEVSDEEEFFSQNSSFQENDVNEQKVLTNVSLNGKDLEKNSEIDKSLIVSKSSSGEQQDMVTDAISIQDFGNVSDLKQLITQMPHSLLSKITKTSDIKSLSSIDGSINYSRNDLLQIRHSKTAEEWKSFLWTNHGTNWPIDEMPFEMDPDLRCSFQKRFNILRDRQEAARRFFVSSRPQIDFPAATNFITERQKHHNQGNNQKNFQNKKNEQRQGKQKTKKNKKGKNGVDVQLKAMKNGNKGNGKLDQKNQASNKVDWTDSEECYESSGSGGLNKKGFSNDDQNIKINSAPIASKWAMKYLENITSSEDDEGQENEQKLLLSNQNDKIAKHQLLVGFPFWHKNIDHPRWHHSNNVLNFYFNQIKKGII
uniref:Uncharacterized protein n=1 Tax=Meloidogyne incognita TaxID=6306 RepID=A0A914KZ48_MELIC